MLYLTKLLSAGSSGQVQAAESTEAAREASAADRGAFERWRVALEEASGAAETLAEAATADAAAAAAAGASHVLKRLAPYMTPWATAPIKNDQVVTASGGGGGGAEAAGGSPCGGSGGDGGGSDGGGSNSGGGRAAARDCAAAAPSAARGTSSEATIPAADKDLCSICLGELSGLQATSIYTHMCS